MDAIPVVVSTEMNAVSGTAAWVRFPVGERLCSLTLGVFMGDGKYEQFSIPSDIHMYVDGEAVTIKELVLAMTAYSAFDVTLDAPVQPSYRHCDNLRLTTHQE